MLSEELASFAFVTAPEAINGLPYVLPLRSPLGIVSVERMKLLAAIAPLPSAKNSATNATGWRPMCLSTPLN
jgi:hypothetical protein